MTAVISGLIASADGICGHATAVLRSELSGECCAAAAAVSVGGASDGSARAESHRGSVRFLHFSKVSVDFCK